MTHADMRRERPSATLELLCDGAAVVVQADDVIVGRTARCTVRVAHPLVSREHCRIEVRADGVYVVDLDSVNGTWLNGSRLDVRTPARAGDRLGLGRDGAVLVVRRAVVGGVDVARLPREEDTETLRAGDPRAVGIVARVAVAPDAVPARGPVDEPTQDVAGAAKPQGRHAPEPRTSAVPVAHADDEPETRTAEVAAPAAPESRPVRRLRFAAGLGVGFIVGLAVIAALAKFTRALDVVRPGAAETRRR